MKCLFTELRRTDVLVTHKRAILQDGIIKLEDFTYYPVSKDLERDCIHYTLEELEQIVKEAKKNKKEKETDWARTEPLGKLNYFCEKCGIEIVDGTDLLQRVKKRRDPFVPTYSYFCKKCYYEKEGKKK